MCGFIVSYNVMYKLSLNVYMDIMKKIKLRRKKQKLFLPLVSVQS